MQSPGPAGAHSKEGQRQDTGLPLQVTMTIEPFLSNAAEGQVQLDIAEGVAEKEGQKQATSLPLQVTLSTEPFLLNPAEGQVQLHIAEQGAVKEALAQGADPASGVALSTEPLLSNAAEDKVQLHVAKGGAVKEEPLDEAAGVKVEEGCQEVPVAVQEEVLGGAKAKKKSWHKSPLPQPKKRRAEEEEAVGGVRRSSRPPKSRLVYVKGVPVLKSNMYDLEEGEPSVFDKELGKGDSWQQQGATLVDPARLRAAKRAAEQQLPRQAKQAPRPTAVDAVHKARIEHNQRIRAAGQAAELKRAAFLAKHLEQLAPFITHNARQTILKKAGALPAAAATLPEPPTSQPECIQGVMREYQLEGLSWLVSKFDHGVNAILADEMGLGKTLQTIAFLSYLKAERGVEGPHLVVVPLSVLPSWMIEFKRWNPELRVVRMHAAGPEEKLRFRQEVLARPSTFDVVVTTYDMIRSAELGNALKTTITWQYLILDEGQKVKNEDSLISHEMRRIHCAHMLMLTGTPIQNNMHELFALLSFMYPDVFTDGKIFDRAFNLSTNRVDDAALEAAHYLLRPFCLRRLKAEVETSLPPKTETRIHCPLSPMQIFWYRKLLVRSSRLLGQVEGAVEEDAPQFKEGGQSWLKAMNLLMQLRKVCCHPYLFPDAEPDFDGHTTDEMIVEASGKMKVLDRLLPKLQAKGHRVVLFSQFNMVLDIIEDYVRMRGLKYRRMDGSVNRVQRMVDMEVFNAPDSPLFIYILNTRAGGLGVNLQTADTCILFDSDWNPQWDVQAMARVHRIGQTKPVHIYRLCTEGTVEERMQARAEQKLYLDQMVNRGSTAQAEKMEALSRRDLLDMLKFGADRILRNEAAAPPSDEQLDAIISREPKLEPKAQDAEGTSGACLSTAQHSARDFNAEQAPLSTLVFQGVDYTEAREQSMKDIAREFWERSNDKRERKNRLVTVDGFQVLSENTYTMEEGGISVLHGRHVGFQPERKTAQRAGVDYAHMDYCQVCWDGGELVCCDRCPVAYHPKCLGLRPKDIPETLWSCPLHTCYTCDRNAHHAGGLLFRCEVCPTAFCEDHRPPGHKILGESEVYQALGQIHPKTACFVTCSARCEEVRKDLSSTFQDTIREHTRDPVRKELLDAVYFPSPPNKTKK